MDPSPISTLPPPRPSPGETHQPRLWQHFLCRKMFSRRKEKKNSTQRPSPPWGVKHPACLETKSEWCGAHTFCRPPDVFIRRCRGGENSRSMRQLVHPIPRLSPGKIYWLQQHPGHIGSSLFLHLLIQKAAQVRRLGTVTGHLMGGGGGPMLERPDLSAWHTNKPPALEASLWNGCSLLINSDFLIATEISNKFHLFLFRV